MNLTYQTAAIILAAGSSSRMGSGRHKLLLPVHDRPVLAHVLDAVLASQARPVILVLGHQPEQVRAHIASYTTHPDLRIIENPHYLQGMSTSLRLGVQALQPYDYTKYADKEVDSALVLLGDQPLITTQHIDALITMYRKTGKSIIAPTYEGKRGNPILFDASLFPELLQITGDEGGRSVLERHPDEIATVEMGSREANIDVDTWEAYQRVVEVWERKEASFKIGETQKKQAQFWLEYSQQLSGTIRYSEALAAVERSLALDDTSMAAWYAKGTYLAMLARYDEALAAFEHASGMDDSYAPAWDGRAWALGILGRRAEALAAVNRALELDPNYFDAIKRKERLDM